MTVPLLNIALAAGGASWSVSMLIVLSQRWHGKHALDHDLDGVQKFHTTAVPRVGGVAVFAAICVSLRLGASIASALLSSWLLGATVSKLDIWGVDALLTWAPFARSSSPEV